MQIFIVGMYVHVSTTNFVSFQDQDQGVDTGQGQGVTADIQDQEVRTGVVESQDLLVEGVQGAERNTEGKYSCLM